jgi:hypothetical protein
MKKFLLIGLVLLSTMSHIAGHAATLAQTRANVDAWITEHVWPMLVARQQNYFSNKGRYWQGLRTHNLIPAHSNGTVGDSIPDQLDTIPDDGSVFETWRTAFPLWSGSAIPAALKCDVYMTPEGLHGWVATIYVMHNGNLYKRSQNVGPESYRTIPWTQVNPSEEF